MNDLSKYVELYRLTTEHDTEVLWSKVNIIREAIADGADVETLLAECGKESGDSAKQVRKFYAVARVFDGVVIAKDLDYWVYEACTTDPRVDPDKPYTYTIAWDWLSAAIDGYDSKQGKKPIRRKHTARTLRAAIREANADAKPGKPETLLKTDATYISMDIVKDTVTLQVPSWVFVKLMGISSIIDQWEVSLTITRTSAPQPASADAAKAVDAA